MASSLRSNDEGYSAPVTRKTVRVMGKITGSQSGVSITELASELELPKSTTHGILAALEDCGWVLRDPLTRRYTCGYSFTDLLGRAKVRISLMDHIHPFLEDLAVRSDEDVFLGTFSSRHIWILDQVESSKKLKVSTRPGTKLSIFAGAAGKVCLAFQDRKSAELLVKAHNLPRFTPRSIVEPVAYLSALSEVRRAGVAFDVEEYIPDVRAVAAPLFLHKSRRSRLVGGIWIVGLSSSMTEAKMSRLGEIAKASAEAASRLITRSAPG
jgi:DNA-binding IclR family transcriptional regulator